MCVHTSYGVLMEERARRIGIRELREQLRSIVSAARSGERIVITARGTPVAAIGPVEDAAGPISLDTLSTAGLIEPPRRRDHPAAPHPHVLPADVRLDRVLDQLRGRT